MQNFNFDLFLANLPPEMVSSDPLLLVKSIQKLFKLFLDLYILCLKFIISA